MSSTHGYMAMHCKQCNDYRVCMVGWDGLTCLHCRKFTRWLSAEQAANDVAMLKRYYAMKKREE